MSVEGKVIIDLPRQAGAAVRVCYSQPGDIARLLEGKTPDEALNIISTLFSVCRTAQAHTAAIALEAALGIAVPQQTAAARQTLTAMETLREQVLRIALDWPRLANSEATPANAIRSVMPLVPQLAAALFGAGPAFAIGKNAQTDMDRALEIISDAEALLVSEIFGEPLEDWAARRGREELLDWADKSPLLSGRMIRHIVEQGWLADAGPDICMPPPFFDAALSAWFSDVAGAAELPDTGGGQTPELTPYSRRRYDPIVADLGGSGLGPRYVTRLVELSRLPGEMRALLYGESDAAYGRRITNGIGIGAVEAARGLLIHGVRMEDGHVASCRILPPTRWNFDQKGIAARYLTQINEQRYAERLTLTHIIVNAIDPCVAYEIRMQ